MDESKIMEDNSNRSDEKLLLSDVMQQREQLFDFLRWYSDERKLNFSDSHILVMIEKYQKSNNCA